MKIKSFDVLTQAFRAGQFYEEQRTTVRETTVSRRQPEAMEKPVIIEISQQAKDAAKSLIEQGENRQSASASAPASKCDREIKASSADEAKLKMLSEIIFRLTGKRLNLRVPELKLHGGEPVSAEQPERRLTASNAGPRQVLERRVSISTSSFTFDSEHTSYSAKAIVNTADGKTLNIDVSMNLSRTFLSYSKVNIQANSPLCDPLIINFEGDAASLSGETFNFDIDLDGRPDKLHFAGEGSGFLALDKNGDGEINDGSELFGPRTGSGFEELRAYDHDKNGWIDENDAIFDRLVVWSRDRDGNDVLFKLKDVNVGAIYLGETKTEFSFKDRENNTLGIMRSTSFFLKEDRRGAGFISHVDLSVYGDAAPKKQA